MSPAAQVGKMEQEVLWRRTAEADSHILAVDRGGALVAAGVGEQNGYVRLVAGEEDRWRCSMRMAVASMVAAIAGEHPCRGRRGRLGWCG
jgi:hypothetical protein